MPAAQLFEDLHRLISQADYEHALLVTDKILNANPTDSDVLQAKLVCLLRLDRYQEALQTLSTPKSAKKTPGAPTFQTVTEAFAFENAYCLYRVNRLEDALQIVRTALDAKPVDRELFRWRHLEAQINYRREDFAACISAYEMLLKGVNKDDSMYDDIVTNMKAVHAAAVLSNQTPQWKNPAPAKVETHEQAYNSACESIASGNLTSAEKHLKKAKSLCQALSAMEYSESDIEQELAPILVQMAYIQQLRGAVNEAADAYQSVIKSKIADEAVVAVAVNNIVACHGHHDLFDAAKKLKNISSEKLDHRLLRRQRSAIAGNLATLALHMNKFSEARNLSTKLLHQYPDSETPDLVRASCAYLQHNPAKALNELADLAKERPDSIPIALARIQLLAVQGSFPQALQVLDGISGVPEEESRPGLVALRIWLYEKTGNKDKVVGLLDRASRNWEKGEEQTSRESRPPASLLRQLAKFKLSSGDANEAMRDFEQLVRSDPGDIQALAGLVIATAGSDPSLAEQHARGLPSHPTDLLVPDLDLNALESVVPGAKKYYLRKSLDGSREMKPKIPKKKKTRRPLLPKQFDTNAKPDPERWLPRHLRTTTRRKGKGRANALKGPQGVAVAGGGIGMTGSANIGGRGSRTNVAEPVTTEKDDSELAVAPPKPSSGGNSSRKNKKGKGRK